MEIPNPQPNPPSKPFTDSSLAFARRRVSYLDVLVPITASIRPGSPLRQPLLALAHKRHHGSNDEEILHEKRSNIRDGTGLCRILFTSTTSVPASGCHCIGNLHHSSRFGVQVLEGRRPLSICLYLVRGCSSSPTVYVSRMYASQTSILTSRSIQPSAPIYLITSYHSERSRYSSSHSLYPTIPICF